MCARVNKSDLVHAVLFGSDFRHFWGLVRREGKVEPEGQIAAIAVEPGGDPTNTDWTLLNGPLKTRNFLTTDV